MSLRYLNIVNAKPSHIEHISLRLYLFLEDLASALLYSDLHRSHMSSIAKYGYHMPSFWSTCPLFSWEMKYYLRTFDNVLLFAFLFYIAITSGVTITLSQGGELSWKGSTVHCTAEVASITFSDSDSTPVSEFWNPGPDPGPPNIKIKKSDSCSDSGYNNRFSRNLLMFLLKKWSHWLLYCRNWKVAPDPGPVFHKFLTSGPDPDPKEKRRILPESTPALRIHDHLCCTGPTSQH